MASRLAAFCVQPNAVVGIRKGRRGRKLHFYARKQLGSYCFSAFQPSQFCLSVPLSVTRMDQSKTVQARITKFLPSAAWKTLVSGSIKLFYKFKKVTLKESAK